MIEHRTATPADVDRDDEWLALALVAAFTTFLRIARKRLGLKHGERCPRCGHSY